MFPSPALAHVAGLLEHPRPDQRSHPRYPVRVEIEYRLLSKGRVERLGVGKTIDVSSGGVLFKAKDALPAGRLIEVLMDWPCLPKRVHPLKLLMQGRVVRSDGKLVAVRSYHHEFRTAGARSS